MDAKKRTREPIDAKIDGVMYSGERVIEGTHKLDQYVIYQNQCIPDLKGYSPEQKDTLMLSISRLLLSELVSGRTLSAQSREKYGI